MIITLRHDNVKLRIKEAERYKQHIDKFVVIEFDNGKKTIGILKEITPAGKLRVVGDYIEAFVDPLADFMCHAREDRKPKRGDRK